MTVVQGLLVCFLLGLWSCNGFLISVQFPDHHRRPFISPTSKTTSALNLAGPSPVIPPGNPPYLALITEPDACADTLRAEATLQTIAKAVSTGKVNLVSIRLTRPSDDKEYQATLARALLLTQRLVELAEELHTFRVVCSSDWIELAMQASAHGIHVKESHLSKIPSIRQDAWREDLLIGTSTHSVDSAKKSYATYRPDYYFVGTCFLTASHPEKSIHELEGPMLPGQVRQALLEEIAKESNSLPTTTNNNNINHYYCPIIFGIGGIDESNCDGPMVHGADGVAVIRAILQAPDPAQATLRIHEKMKLA